MTETIDSNQQKLTMSEIVLHAVQRASEEGELPPGVNVMAGVTAITAEASMPNTDVKQIGNTVFISHFSRDKIETSTRGFNMDSARNFVDNTVEYATSLADAGVRRVTIDFKGDSIKQMLIAVSRTPIASQNWGMQLFKTTDGGFRAYINLTGVAQ